MPRILVIDDDEHFRLYMEALLERAGYTVRVCWNGANVETILRGETFDAIIVDLFMPDADGIETVRAAKHVAPAIPIIGVTGAFHEPNDPYAKVMILYGAAAVLTKPLDPARLLDALERALRCDA